MSGAVESAGVGGGEVIWSKEEIERRLGHESPEVRRWAMDRLALFDPAAAAAAGVRLLGAKDPEELSAALKALEEAPNPEWAEALRRVLRRSDLLPGHEQSAWIALVRCGAVGAVELRESTRGVPKSVVKSLWIQAGRRDPAGTRAVLLAALGAGGGAVGIPAKERAALLGGLIPIALPEDIPWLLVELGRVDDEDEEGLVGSLLERCGASDLLLPLDRDEAKEFLDDRERDCAEAGVEPEELFSREAWKLAKKSAGRDRPGGSAPAFGGVEEVPEALRELEIWSRGVVGALAGWQGSGRMAVAMTVALALAAGRRRFLRGALEGAPAERLVRLLSVVSEVEREAVFGRLLGQWKEGAREAIERAVMEGVSGASASWVQREAVELAGRLEGFGGWGVLLDAVDGEFSDEGAGRLADLLVDRPAVLRELAEGRLGRGGKDGVTRDAVLLDALGRQPYRWASRVVAERLGAILDTGEGGMAWEALAMLGDPATLDAALREWRPGERKMAWTIYQMAMVADRVASLPEGLAKEAKEHQRDRSRLLSNVGIAVKVSSESQGLSELAKMFDGPMRVELACERCGRNYWYEVGQVFLHPDRKRCEKEGWDGVTFSRIIVCKNCGAEDEYRLTAGAHAMLLGWLMTHEAGGRRLTDPESPVTTCVPTLYDGTVLRRPTLGLKALRAKVAARPTDGEAWRRLGNLAKRYGRLEEAESAWRKALEVDPKELDAACELADLHLQEGRLGEAAAAAFDALHRFHLAKRDDEARDMLAQVATAVLQALAEVVRERRELAVAWTDGGRAAKEKDCAVTLSSVDLRRFRHWEALYALIRSGSVLAMEWSGEKNVEHPTMLERLLASGALGGGGAELSGWASGGGWGESAAASVARSAGHPGRNAPCPCGSGKKYKRCCGR